VTEAVKLITGVGRSLLGRLALYDALGGTWREIKVTRDPAAARITELTDYEAFCGITPTADAGTEHTVTATQLATMLASRKAGLKDFRLVDVRERGEYEIVRIEGSELIPQGRILAGEAWQDLPQDAEIVFHCKAGTRSAAVLSAARAAGYERVSHLEGGILAWVRDVEPGKPVY
jgi:adenylyltransferase/sulfurtransferase